MHGAPSVSTKACITVRASGGRLMIPLAFYRGTVRYRLVGVNLTGTFIAEDATAAIKYISQNNNFSVSVGQYRQYNDSSPPSSSLSASPAPCAALNLIGIWHTQLTVIASAERHGACWRWPGTQAHAFSCMLALQHTPEGHCACWRWPGIYAHTFSCVLALQHTPERQSACWRWSGTHAHALGCMLALQHKAGDGSTRTRRRLPSTQCSTSTTPTLQLMSTSPSWWVCCVPDHNTNGLLHQ